MKGNFSSKRDKGDFYEDAVVLLLKKKGYKLLERNYFAKLGEVDIIAEDVKKRTLIFVEVKSKEKSGKVHPFEAVDVRKQKKIILAASEYMMAHNITDYFIRFDVAGVILDGNKIESIEVVEDAFQAG
ncbi:MAG: YraN family protein [bacterium]